MKRSAPSSVASATSATPVASVVSAVLLVLACLLVPVGTLSVWARYEVGDSERYAAATASLAGNAAVREAVADAVTDGIMGQVDAGPLASVTRDFVRGAVTSFTGTDAFRSGWDAANRAARDAVQRAVDDGRDGDVTLDLAPVTRQVKQQLQADGVPFADRIPDTRTHVTLIGAGDLGALRTTLRLLQAAGPWPLVAAVVCAAAGLALATRRRRALAATALGVALAAAALLVALAVSRSLTLDGLASGPNRRAAGAVYDTLTSSMRTASWWLVAGGAVVGAGVWLAGRLGSRGR